MRGLLEQRLGGMEVRRTRRLAGLHRFLVKVRPDEFQPMLAYLRGLAPEAEGPP